MITTLLVVVLALAAPGVTAAAPGAGATPTPAAPAGQTPATFFGLSFTDINGNAVPLADYAGRPVLVVNTASKCGFTKQYAGLQALHEAYGPRGLVVIGFPSNDFGNQEPGTEQQIAEFCQANYGVTFQLASKVAVKGPDRHPVFAFLTEPATAGAHAGQVKWNFTKFLISPGGQVVARFASRVDPMSDEVKAAVEAQLAAADKP